MAGLTQLQVLEITDQCSLGGGVEPLPDAQMQQYSNLLPASSQLSSVTFTTANSHMLTQPGCIRAVFNPARQLDHVKELTIDLSFPAIPDDEEGLDEHMVFRYPELEVMAQCCPSLTKLHIPGLMWLGPDKSVLLRWQNTLTSLAVGGNSFTNASVAGVLVKLTNLSKLTIKNSSYLGDLGLFSMTQMTKLSELIVENCAISQELENGHNAVRLLTAVRTPPSDVCVLCVCCGACA